MLVIVGRFPVTKWVEHLNEPKSTMPSQNGPAALGTRRRGSGRTECHKSGLNIGEASLETCTGEDITLVLGALDRAPSSTSNRG